MDNIEKLQQLKQLLDEGILSQEEFDSRKEQIIFPEKIEEERRKLEEEKIRQEEENRKNEVFDNAVKKADEKTIDSYKEALSELEGLGEWRDAHTVVEKYKAELAELEKEEAERKAESEREKLYETAIKKFEVRTSKAYKSAIADLESLGEWKDAAEKAEEFRPELLKIEKEEDNKKKKNKKKIIIGAAAVVAAIVIFFAAKALLTPNLADFNPTKAAKINSMSYKIPENSKLEESDDNYALYTLSKSNKNVGVLEVRYKGDTDLDGAAGATTDHMTSKNVAAKLISGATGKYDTVTADNSEFEVAVYCNTDKVKGQTELLKAVTDSLDVSGYKNPRTSEGIKVSYTGDTSAGVKIEKGVDGLSVSETYKTVKGTGTKDASYTISKPVKLEAGETSTVTVSVDGKDYELKVACSDRGAFYKNGSFTASFDEIMTDYIEQYDAIHLFGSSKSAGAHLNIYKKGNDYGGQLNCDTTDRTSIMVFSSMADNGNDFLPADKTPENIMVMIQTDGKEETEDVMCFLAAFSNLLCTLDPGIDENVAYNDVKDAFVDDIRTTRTCKGIDYILVGTTGLYMFKIEG